MSKTVGVALPAGWMDESANNSGGITLIRDASEHPGALQVSVGEYKGGEIPDPSESDLREMAVALGRKMNCGDLVESRSGSCALGKFGTAVFRNEESSRTQIWQLSDGKDFVLVTHIFVADESCRTPNTQEIAEAESMVGAMKLVEAPPPWWKFWAHF